MEWLLGSHEYDYIYKVILYLQNCIIVLLGLYRNLFVMQTQPAHYINLIIFILLL